MVAQFTFRIVPTLHTLQVIRAAWVAPCRYTSKFLFPPCRQSQYNLLLYICIHRHHDKARAIAVPQRRVNTRKGVARFVVYERWYKFLTARRLPKIKSHYKEARNFEYTYMRNPKRLESPVVYVTVVTIRKVNCATIYRRFIAVCLRQVLSSMRTQPDSSKINLARQKKNGPNFCTVKNGVQARFNRRARTPSPIHMLASQGSSRSSAPIAATRKFLDRHQP